MVEAVTSRDDLRAAEARATSDYERMGEQRDDRVLGPVAVRLRRGRSESCCGGLIIIIVTPTISWILEIFALSTDNNNNNNN